MSLPEMNMWQYRDKHGDILPWFTDTFLRELVTWDLKDKWVLEWGSGWSTLWWANHVARVRSIEHDPVWWELVRAITKDTKFPLWHDLYIRLTESVYSYQGSSLDNLWDIIVIDGKWRVECAVEAMKIVKLGGIIILDNSNYPELAPIHKLLAHCESHHYPQTGHPDWVTSYWKVTSRSNPAAAVSYEDAAKAQEEYRKEHPGSATIT